MSKRSTGIRFVIAAALVAASFAWAPPASSAPRIRFGADCPETAPTPPASPPPACTPRTGQAIRGSHAISFTVEAGGVARIRRVEIRVLSEDPEIESPGSPRPKDPVWAEEYPVDQAPATRTYTYTWDTKALTPRNGAYTFHVRAFNHAPDSTSSNEERKDIRVDNPPAVPAAPKVVASSARGVSLSWSASPEPDIRGYTLYRARTSSKDDEPERSEYRVLLTTAETEVFDEINASGVYWYRLRATRRSVVTPDEGISSGLSARAEDPGVVVKPTPTPDDPALQSTPRPRASLAPMAALPVTRPSSKPPPVPDAPFSTVLDYGDLPELADDEASYTLEERGRVRDRVRTDEARRRTLPAAIGVFMVSAWAVLTRSRVLT